MKISPLSRTADLGFNRQLGRNRAQREQALGRISTGKRVNRAGDDAAAASIIAQLSAEIASASAASRNVDLGAASLSIADGALQSQQDITTRMRELAVQSSNGTLNDGDRAIIQAEFGQLAAELDRIAGVTEFNGTQVLQGASVETQVGTGSGDADRIEVSTPDATAAGLGVAGLSVADAGDALSALDALDSAIQGLSEARAEVGAGLGRLDNAQSTIESTLLANTAALSRVRDADIAEEVSNERLAGIRESFGVAAYRRSPQAQADLFSKLL